MAETETRLSIDDPELAVAGNEDGQPDQSSGENMRQHWSFIRKFYMILAIQLLLTVGVSAIVVIEPTIPADLLMIHTVPGAVVYILTLAVPFIILWVLHAHKNHHPQNMVLLILFTVTLAVAVGFSCSFPIGRIILLALILSSVAVVTLLLYTFWAEKRGYDINNFVGPFMRSTFSSVLLLFALLQAIVPSGELNSTVYRCLLAIIFSSFVIYETEKLIKNFDDEEYITASVSIYLDTVMIFQNKLNAECVNSNTSGDEGSAPRDHS